MPRLPKPGADAGQWGDILNDFLSQSHDTDGTLRDNVVGVSQLQDNAITNVQLADNSVQATTLADGAVTSTKIADGAVTNTHLDSTTKASLAKADTAVQPTDATYMKDSTGRRLDSISVPSTGEVATAYAPIRSAASLAGAVAKAEQEVSAGTVPSRLAFDPTTVACTKGNGITGTPTVSAGGGGYAVGDQITLAGGTALSTAVLQVATLSGSAVATVTVVRNGAYTATPSNAVAQASTTGSGTGATFTVSWSTTSMSTAISRALVSATDARFRFTGNGPLTNEGSSGYYGAASNAVHSSFEWATNSQRIDVRLGGLSTSGVLYVDGRQISSAMVQTDASGAGHIFSIDLGSSVVRQFKWIAFNQAFAGVYIDGTATLTAPVAVTPPLAWSLGDSYTGATGAENAATTHVSVMCDRLGIDVISDGVGGSGWNSTGSNVPATRVARLAAMTRTPDYVFLDLGYNDAGGNMETLATAFDAAVSAIRSAAPSARILCFGPATPRGATTNLDAVRTALIARCVASGIPFVDVRNWVTSANSAIYTGGDNVHPTARGHKYLGVRRAETVRPLL